MTTQPEVATNQPTPGRPRIVVGLDESAGARAALAYAFDAAVRRGADLDVVSAYPVVLPWTGGSPMDVPNLDAVRQDTHTRTGEFLEDVRTELTATRPAVADVQTRLRIAGGPAPQVLVAQSQGADLLVVGSRGRGAVRSALLGSVALHCITHAQCPVAVVHAAGQQVETPSGVVVGVDGSETSRAALRAGLLEAARLDTDVEVVAAYLISDYWPTAYPIALAPLIDVDEEVRKRADQVVQAVVGELSEELGARMPKLRLEVIEGSTVDVLVGRGQSAQLLVLGTRGHGSIRGLLLGSVALRAAMHSSCPVLLVPPSSGRPAPAPRTEQDSTAAMTVS